MVVPDFDFTEALKLPPDDRMAVAVERVRDGLARRGRLDRMDLPPVPAGGASEAELEEFERGLGAELPAEYRRFLRRWRYLIVRDGVQVWGFDHEGLSVGRPLVSGKHLPGHRHLVFADYFRFAAGDQLLIDLRDPRSPVVTYLHEHGPLFEPFAPSFSPALWRLAQEGPGVP